MLKVFIIVLNWNGLKHTIECLESLKKIDYSNFEIIVVDNGSADGSSEKIKKLFPEIILLQNKNNLGYAEGNNVGIRFALKNGADYLFLLNNDTIVKRDTVSLIVEEMEKDLLVGMASPVILKYNQLTDIENIGFFVDINTGMTNFLLSKSFYNSLPGSALMVRVSVVNKIGMLDPQFYLYGEDKDWCFRCVENGYRLLVVEKAMVWHKHSISSGGPASATSLYYTVRNRRLFCEKRKKKYLLWLIKNYIFFNLRYYFSFLPQKDTLKTSAILSGLLDGLRQKYGEKKRNKKTEYIFYLITNILHKIFY